MSATIWTLLLRSSEHAADVDSSRGRERGTKRTPLADAALASALNVHEKRGPDTLLPEYSFLNAVIAECLGPQETIAVARSR